MAQVQYAAPAASKLLDILELMVTIPEGVSLSELSRRLDISINSAFRICRVLEERGYIMREQGSGLLSLTNKLYALGARLGDRIDLIALARPVLQSFTEATGENAHFCVLRDDHLLLLCQTVSPHPVRVVVDTGTLLVPQVSAFGKVILAFLPEAERRRYLQATCDKFTPYTVTDPAQIADGLTQVREAGIAYDFEEYQLGVRCIGAPVFDAQRRVVAGIGIMGPSYRLTPDMLSQYAPMVRAGAARVSEALGVQFATLNDLPKGEEAHAYCTSEDA